LKNLHKWDNGDKLVREVNFIIFVRFGYKITPETLPQNYILINTSFVASSSTEIRNRVKNYYKAHHNSRKLVHIPTMCNIYDVDCKYTGKLLGLERIDHSRTIDKKEIRVDDIRIKLEEKYMGIFGIATLSVIKYIKENRLYCDDL